MGVRAERAASKPASATKDMGRGWETSLWAETKSVDLGDDETAIRDLFHRVAVEVAAPCQPRPQGAGDVFGESNDAELGTNVLVEAEFAPWTQDASGLGQGCSQVGDAAQHQRQNHRIAMPVIERDSGC